MRRTLCISGMPQVSKNSSNADRAQQFLCKANNTETRSDTQGQLSPTDSSRVIAKNGSVASLAFGAVQGKGLWKIVNDEIGDSAVKAKSGSCPGLMYRHHKSLLGICGTEDVI